MKKHYLYAIYMLLAILCILPGCKKQSDSKDSDENIFEEAVYIKGAPVGRDSMRISITDPWDSTAMLAEYLLINPTDGKQSAATADRSVLHLPLKRMIVYSSVHAALLTELGYVDAIVGVADAEYIKIPEIVERLQDGRIVNIGSSMEPSLEKIIALKPDAILMSPFQNSGHGVVDKAGVPVIECADYMERTPLGRAEWSKFYAMLVEGISDNNSATYLASKQRYNALVEQGRQFKDKPTVITELPNAGSWTIPGGRSYAARLLSDAGAVYPFMDNKSTGSITLNYEKMYVDARDADFWLVKSFDSDLKLNDIEKINALNKNFKALKNGGIYFSNTAKTNLFEEFPFHPELLLADYVAIFHHTGAKLRYFAPVK
jgi:iron complex transport system substrate-binding protein